MTQTISDLEVCHVEFRKDSKNKPLSIRIMDNTNMTVYILYDRERYQRLSLGDVYNLEDIEGTFYIIGKPIFSGAKFDYSIFEKVDSFTYQRGKETIAWVFFVFFPLVYWCI